MRYYVSWSRLDWIKRKFSSSQHMHCRIHFHTIHTGSQMDQERKNLHFTTLYWRISRKSDCIAVSVKYRLNQIQCALKKCNWYSSTWHTQTTLFKCFASNRSAIWLEHSLAAMNRARKNRISDVHFCNHIEFLRPDSFASNRPWVFFFSLKQNK